MLRVFGLGSGAIQESWCLGSYLGEVESESTQGWGDRMFAPGPLPSNGIDGPDLTAGG